MDPETKPAQPAPAPASSDTRQTALPTISVTPSVPTEFLSQLERAKLEASQREAEAKKLAATLEETKALLAQLTEKVQLTEKEKAALSAERKAEKIRYEARQAAMAHGAVDPDDVVALVQSALAVSDAGAVVTAGDNPQPVESFIKSYLEKKPHLAKARTAQGSGASPFPAAPPAATGATGAGAAPAKTYDLNTREGATAAFRDGVFAALAEAAAARGRAKA